MLDTCELGSWTVLASSNIWLQLTNLMFPIFSHPSDLEGSLKTALKLHWKGPHHELLTTDIAAKLEMYWHTSHSSGGLHVIPAAAAKSLQSCPTLCDPIDGSPPGSPIPGILQARTLERVTISFSNTWKWKVKVKSLSRVRLFATPWTAAYQAPPSMGFSRWEYWSGVSLPSPNYRRLGCKSRNSRNTWSNRQIWPWSTEWSRANS